MQVTTEDVTLARRFVRAIAAEREESDADYSLRVWEAEQRAKDLTRRIAAGEGDNEDMTVVDQTNVELAALRERKLIIEACQRLAAATATAYEGVDSDKAAEAEDRIAAYQRDVAETEAGIADLTSLISESQVGIEAAGGTDFLRFTGGETVVFE